MPAVEVMVAGNGDIQLIKSIGERRSYDYEVTRNLYSPWRK